MKLTGIHFLLSYRCTYECDHCFVWGSPQADGAMTLAQVRDVLRQARDLGTVDMVYFEGGEPFLFYPIMLASLREAAALGFDRGVVTNCYWATSVEDAVHWLRPIAEIGLSDLSLSSDLFHGEAMMTQTARNAVVAAEQLSLPEGVITIEVPEGCTTYSPKTKGEPVTGGAVRFRGRAVTTLTDGVPRLPATPGARQQWAAGLAWALVFLQLTAAAWVLLEPLLRRWADGGLGVAAATGWIGLAWLLWLG